MTQHKEAIKELITKIADDQLVLGHRNSEWTGFGPIVEEDIAFSSMAQDKIGHALALYQLLHDEFGVSVPDQFAFNRTPEEFKSSHFTELPMGEYDFNLMRHFLFDHAEFCRIELLEKSSYKPLAQLARKFRGEVKYHILHGDTWIKRLGNSTEEAHARMQSALNEAFPYALSMFEPGDHESELQESEVFAGEAFLQDMWLGRINSVLTSATLTMPDISGADEHYGGRKGYHTEHLQPLLNEMTEVFSMDPEAEW